MGTKNTISKEYMSDNIKFADVFNYFLYNGKQVIQPKSLSEKDITETSIPYKGKEMIYPVEKYRDILKKCIIKKDQRYIYLLLGIENQSDIHYAMPVRNMLYDALNYSGQVSNIARNHRENKDSMTSPEFLSGITNDDKLIPVFTLVIYWGNDKWNAPRSLYEMFREIDLNTARFLNDYRINLIAPNEIKDFSMFQSELGKVLEFINASDDIDKMKKILEDNREYYLHMDVDSAKMIEEFGKTKLELEKYNEKEEIDMCKAIDDMIQEAVEEKETEMCKAIDGMIQEAVEEKETEMCKAIDGMIQEAVEEKETEMCKAIDGMIQEAVEEKETEMCKAIDGMIQKAAQKKLIDQICKKIKKNKPVDVIADELEENVDDIQEIYNKIAGYAPAYDADLICEEILEYN